MSSETSADRAPRVDAAPAAQGDAAAPAHATDEQAAPRTRARRTRRRVAEAPESAAPSGEAPRDAADHDATASEDAGREPREPRDRHESHEDAEERPLEEQTPRRTHHTRAERADHADHDQRGERGAERDQRGERGERFDRQGRRQQREQRQQGGQRTPGDRGGAQQDRRRGQRPDREAQAGGKGGRLDRNDRNDRRQRRQQSREVAEPKTNRDEIAELKVADLRAKAAELGIEATGLKKAELVDAVYAGMVREEGFFEFHGILDVMQEGYGFVRTKGYLPSEGDVYVGAQMIRQIGLRRGDELVGIGHAGRPNDKYAALSKVSSANGLPVEEARNRPRFGDLTPVFPTERLRMEHGKDSILGRCIDIVAPVGKGQRGLIVSPPKAGKTTVLKSIAGSIAANNPEVHLICLLVDERPEEVTDMQRSIRGEVVASTFDMPSDNHITVSELVIERAKRLVELGQDVVILLDSITRLARAYNLAQPASGRILSGGVDSTALYPPKRFLGAARNIENGGSLTILASALVETGSKMDEVIFEEFKGTGNMELRLDRDLADRRIFPAIDPISSGTRKEELLIDPSMAPFVWGLRRILAGMNNNERAMTQLIRGLKQTPDNREFLIRCAKKAQMQDISF
ncbi:transcription termination factor Rho [bacterium]|nr:transcription termination factor Rho [bacterium]